MAHFAQVDDTGTVVRVVVIHNNITTDLGVEDEQHGIDYLTGLFPNFGTWVQTSYNATVRHNFAAAGCSWDGAGFAAPQPFESWALDSDYQWQAPAPMPSGEAFYNWDEDTLSWVEADVPV